MKYKGSKCQICNYDKYQGALDFHHLDPNEKDFSIGEATSRVLNSKIKAELDKCILVCSNCHRELHGGIIIFNDTNWAIHPEFNLFCISL